MGSPRAPRGLRGGGRTIDELSPDLGAGGRQGGPSALRAEKLRVRGCARPRKAHRPPGRLGGRFVFERDETGIVKPAGASASRRAYERSAGFVVALSSAKSRSGV